MVDKTPAKGATLELQPEYVSNGSSLGGEHFYDAADAFENSHASVGCSSSYCSATSSRFESGGAGTLLPTQKAVELMAALASADSSNDAYVSAARLGSGGERNVESSPLGFVVLDEGAPGGTLGLDSFDLKKGRKSTNPFDEENLNNTADELTPTTAGIARRQWHSHQPPPRMVVMDISSAETTPVQTPTDTPANSISGGGAPAAVAAGGADEGGSTSLWGGRSPSPSPLPPPRPHSRGDYSIATNTNPFVTANGGSLIDLTLNTNPFVTANSGSPLNPFPPDDMEAVAAKEEGSSSIERVAGGDDEAAVVAAGSAAAVAAARRSIESVVVVTACGAEGKNSRKPTPPPLPPRTPTPSKTVAQRAAIREAFFSWRHWSRRQDDSSRPSHNTSVSTSGSSSVGSDKFMIVDKVSAFVLLIFCSGEKGGRGSRRSM